MGSEGSILVVDDDPDIARFIAVILEAEGFDVALAEDGQAGLDRTLELRPDLVLTNVNMPGIGGFEMVQRIRATSETADTPIVMLTAKALDEDKRQGLVSGADDYLIKPFDPVELVARIRATLGRCRQPGYGRPLQGDTSATVDDAVRYLAAMAEDAERDPG